MLALPPRPPCTVPSIGLINEPLSSAAPSRRDERGSIRNEMSLWRNGILVAFTQISADGNIQRTLAIERSLSFSLAHWRLETGQS